MMLGNLKLIRAKGKNGKIEVLLDKADYRITVALDAERWTRSGLYGTPLTLPPLRP